MSEEKDDSLRISTSLAVGALLASVLLGVVLCFVLTKSTSIFPDNTPTPVPHRPILPDRDRRTNGERWISSCEKGVSFGLRKDGSVVWEYTRNTGDAAPTGQAPIGEAPEK